MALLIDYVHIQKTFSLKEKLVYFVQPPPQYTDTALHAHLHHSLKHGDEDECDESNLSCWLGDLFSVHERSHRKPFSLLPVTLSSTVMLNITLFFSIEGKQILLQCSTKAEQVTEHVTTASAPLCVIHHTSEEVSV